MSDSEQDSSSLSQVAPMFHGILFAYQKGVADATSKALTTVIDGEIIRYLDMVFRDSELAEGVAGDSTGVMERLEAFAGSLVQSGLVEEAEVDSKYNGYILTVDGCMFSEDVHEILDPEDVICPLGIVAHYLVEEGMGVKTRKSLSKFTDEGSKTFIDFSEEKGDI